MDLWTMYNMYEIVYLIAVYKPEAGNTVYSSWWWAVCPSKHVEPSINFVIINSTTKLHLVGISIESCNFVCSGRMLPNIVTGRKCATTGCCRKSEAFETGNSRQRALRNEWIHNLYCGQNIITETEWRMRWAGHTTRNFYKFQIRKLNGRIVTTGIFWHDMVAAVNKALDLRLPLAF
jgi:hypothetical protein